MNTKRSTGNSPRKVSLNSAGKIVRPKGSSSLPIGIIKSTLPHGMVKRGRRAYTYLKHLNVSKAFYTTYQHSMVLGDRAPSFREVVYVDPNKIVGHLSIKQALDIRIQTGYKSSAIAFGDWDKKVEYLSFKEMYYYISCHQHWVEGYKWEDTELYNYYLNKLKKGVHTQVRNVKELDERYQKLDRIYEEVSQKRSLSEKFKDLVKVNIARDGRLVWGPNGKHRICIALIVGLDEIPMRVGYIHPDALDYFQLLRKSN